ncbi:MAG: hypothetical protein R3Y46_07565 [Opitutales bacterium]
MKSAQELSFHDELRNYFNEKMIISGIKDPDIDDLEIWTKEFQEIYNNRGVDDFEGFSPTQMRDITYNLWCEKFPINFRKLADEDFKQIPIFCQVEALLNILVREGKIKLTATGALPRKYVQEIYPYGVPYEYIEDISKINREHDCSTVVITHILAKLTKVVDIQKGTMTLSNIGKKMLQDKQSLLESMIKSFTTKLNFAYFDRYHSDNIGMFACAFSIILMAKYGDKELSCNFYSNKYFQAFPAMKEDYTFRSSYFEDDLLACYKRRTFDIFFENFGLITYTKRNNCHDRKAILKKTKIFDKIFDVEFP